MFGEGFVRDTLSPFLAIASFAISALALWIAWRRDKPSLKVVLRSTGDVDGPSGPGQL